MNVLQDRSGSCRMALVCQVIMALIQQLSPTHDTLALETSDSSSARATTNRIYHSPAQWYSGRSSQ
jgi:hypothetical protein